jgi:hypothetical protein
VVSSSGPRSGWGDERRGVSRLTCRHDCDDLVAPEFASEPSPQPSPGGRASRNLVDGRRTSGEIRFLQTARFHRPRRRCPSRFAKRTQRRWRFKLQISNPKSERGRGERSRRRCPSRFAKRTQRRWRFKLQISNPKSERGREERSRRRCPSRFAKRTQRRWRFKLQISNPISERGRGEQGAFRGIAPDDVRTAAAGPQQLSSRAGRSPGRTTSEPIMPKRTHCRRTARPRVHMSIQY